MIHNVGRMNMDYMLILRVKIIFYEINKVICGYVHYWNVIVFMKELGINVED